MRFCLSHLLPGSTTRRVSSAPRRLAVRLAALAVLTLSVALRADAGPGPRLLGLGGTVAPAPTIAPKAKLSKLPHLVAIGPMEISVQPVAGPRLRRAPLLPPPKAIEVETDPAPKTPPPSEPTPREPAEPSAFSPDAPPTLLPKDEPPAPPAPAEKKEEARETVLVPVVRGEPELKDAVIYFETPAGPRGSQITVPAIVPFNSPVSIPQPESRATYRKEKE